MATMNRAAKQVRGRIRDTRQWCERAENDRRNQNVKDIRKHLAKNDSTRAVLCLFHPAHWYAQHGVRMILDAETDGWANIDRSFRYLWLFARVMKHSMQASMAASVLANALVFEEDAMAEPLAARLIQSLDDQKIYNVWIESAFAAFMVKLWGLYHGREIDVARPKIAPLRVYQGILDAWHDDNALAGALSAACDYHLDQTGEGGYAEFYFSPYALFPVDILAIGTVRRKLGVSMPEFFHPLMDTPLAKVPPAAERPRMGPDPLFDEVVASARKAGLIS